MRVIRRTDQGGSIASYVIVGVILALGLIGAVYFLRLHGEQVRKDQAIAAYEQEKANTTVTVETEDETQGESEEVVDTEEISIPENTEVEKTPTEIPQAPKSTSQDLPTTGPESVISELVGVFLLTVFSTSLISSRRKLVRSL